MLLVCVMAAGGSVRGGRAGEVARQPDRPGRRALPRGRRRSLLIGRRLCRSPSSSPDSRSTASGSARSTRPAPCRACSSSGATDATSWAATSPRATGAGDRRRARGRRRLRPRDCPRARRCSCSPRWSPGSSRRAWGCGASTAPAPPRPSAPARKAPLPRAGIWLFGFVILAAFTLDSGVSTWSTVYLHDDLLAAAAIAPLGYAAYQGAVLVTRLVTDRATRRWGRLRVVVTSTTRLDPRMPRRGVPPVHRRRDRRVRPRGRRRRRARARSPSPRRARWRRRGATRSSRASTSSTTRGRCSARC